jgi:hypothetical protein
MLASLVRVAAKELPRLARTRVEAAVVVHRVALVVRGAAQLLERPERRHLRQLRPAGRRIAEGYLLQRPLEGVGVDPGVNLKTLLQADPPGGLRLRQSCGVALPPFGGFECTDSLEQTPPG